MAPPAVYAGLYFLVFFLAVGRDRLTGMAESFDPYRGQAIGFISLTLPFVLYFAVCESSRWQGTVGKRALGLVVVRTDDSRLAFARSLGRAALKFLPWEVAHVFTNHLFAHVKRAPDAPEPAWLWGLCSASSGAAVLYVVTLFVGTGRTPYDRAAGTEVRRAGGGHQRR